MSTRTNAQLAQDFPINTVAKLRASIKSFDSLVLQGFLGDAFDVPQIRASLHGALVAEIFGAPVVAFTGTAGTAFRKYSVMPTYALPVDPKRKLFGLISAGTPEATSPASLDDADFFTITAPAVANIPGVTFTILVQFSANGPYLVVARNVAAGASYSDKGAGAGVQGDYLSRFRVPALTEVGYDAASTSAVYGSLTR